MDLELYPGQVVREPGVNVGISGFGTAEAEGGDAGQVPAAVVEVALQRASRISDAGADGPIQFASAEMTRLNGHHLMVLVFANRVV